MKYLINKTKMSLLNYYFIFFYLISLAVEQNLKPGPKENEDYPNISCGKSNPKKEKDCTKYGTDSGMLCCWVTKKKNSEEGKKCTLLSKKTAEDTFDLKGAKEFIDSYWSCGNKSFYLRTDISFIVILIVLTLLY